MKIAHLIFSLTTGGTEHMLVDIINVQAQHVRVTLFILNDEVNQEILKGLSARTSCKSFKRKRKSRNPLYLLRLNVALLSGGFDVIHCHNYNMIGLLLPALRRKALLTIHDPAIQSDSLAKYRNCFAISHAVRDAILSRHQVNSKVVQNGVPFGVVAARRGSERQHENFRVLQIGRLNHTIKGQHIAIRALKLLKNNGVTNVQLDLIGEGPSETYLKALVEEYGLSSQVRFLGMCSRAFVYQSLQYYDLLVQPSLYEGFGLTVVEAMAAKIPVLVSNIEGPMEIIEGGKYGYHFETENAADMADKLADIIHTDAMQLHTRLENAYAYAKEKFDISNTALTYLKEYQQYV